MRTPPDRRFAPFCRLAIAGILAVSRATAQESGEPAGPSESIESVEPIEKDKPAAQGGRRGLFRRITGRDEEVADDPEKSGVFSRIAGFVGERLARVVDQDVGDEAGPDEVESEEEKARAATPAGAEADTDPEILVSIAIEEPFWPVEGLAGESASEFVPSSRAEVESIRPPAEVYVAGFGEVEATRESVDSEGTFTVPVVPVVDEPLEDSSRQRLASTGGLESSGSSPDQTAATQEVGPPSRDSEPDSNQESASEAEAEPESEAEPRGLISTLRLFGRTRRSASNSEPDPANRHLAQGKAKSSLQLNWGSRLRSWLERGKESGKTKTALGAEPPSRDRTGPVDSEAAEPITGESEGPSPSPAGFFAGLQAFFGDSSGSRPELETLAAHQLAPQRKRRPGREPASSPSLVDGYLTATSPTKFFQLSVASREARDVEVRPGTVFKVRRAGDHYTQVETAGGLTGLMQTELLRVATVREAEAWDRAAAVRISAAAEQARSGWRPVSKAAHSETGSITEIPPDEVPLGMGLLTPGE